MTANKQNAQDVQAHIETALKGLIDVQVSLREAISSAALDYPGNDQALRNIQGAVSLATSAIAVERGVWQSWKDAR